MSGCTNDSLKIGWRIELFRQKRPQIGQSEAPWIQGIITALQVEVQIFAKPLPYQSGGVWFMATVNKIYWSIE